MPTYWYETMNSQLSPKDNQRKPGIRSEESSAPHCSQRFRPSALALFAGQRTNFLQRSSEKLRCLSAHRDAIPGQQAFINHSVTREKFGADHWLILSQADGIARKLEAQIGGIVRRVSADVTTVKRLAFIRRTPGVVGCCMNDMRESSAYL